MWNFFCVFGFSIKSMWSPTSHVSRRNKQKKPRARLLVNISLNFKRIYTERQKSWTTFSFHFFQLKINDFKNQFSLVFVPVQMTIVAEKIKCVGNHTYIFGRKM